MNIALRKSMTLEQFLDWEDRQPLRHEFDGAQTFAMTGGTEAHAGIQRNILIALGTRLRGKPCRAYGSELKIIVNGSVRYPDAFITCTPVPPLATTVTEPTIIFEILSRSTEHIDLMVKNAEYRATPSVQRYVILQQTHAAALVFHRRGQDWLAETIAADGSLDLPEAGIAVPMTELYADVTLVGEASDFATA